MAFGMRPRLEHCRIKVKLQPVTKPPESSFRSEGELLIPQPEHRVSAAVKLLIQAAVNPPPAQQRAPTDTDAAAMAFNPAAGFGMHPGAHVAGELDDPHRTTEGAGLHQLLISLK